MGNTIFRTFLLYALTYWAEILHMTLLWCITEQVRVSSLCVNFWRSYASFWTKNIGNTQFSAVFSCMLWHIELKFSHDFVLMYYRSNVNVVILRQFLKELCLFLNLEYRKCTVFRTFLLHALTYWAEILHMTLF